MKNKKFKILLITIIVLILGYLGIKHLMYKAGEYIFKTEIINAEEVSGKTDNNQYGIRNDVYDYLENDLFKNNQLSEEEKTIALNSAYIDQKLFENFSDEASVIKYIKLQDLVISCDGESFEKNSNLTISSDTKYYKILENTESRTMARHVYESIYVKNSKLFRGLPTEEECTLLKTKLLKDID